MIVHVAVDFAKRGRAAAQPEAPLGHFLLEDPGRAVHVVHQRLRHVVAGKPAEMVPVAELVLRLAIGRIALDDLVRAAEEHDLHGNDLADRPVVDPLDRFAISVLIAALQSREQTQVVLLRQCGGGLHAADTRPDRCRAASPRRRACRRGGRPPRTSDGTSTHRRSAPRRRSRSLSCSRQSRGRDGPRRR